MHPSRFRSAARRSVVVVVAVVQAALVVVAAPPAHAAGSLGTVTVSSDVTVKEPAAPGAPSTATFEVALARTGSGTGTVTVDYHTVAGTATPDVDYVSTSGSLVFAGSETTKPVPVSVFYDAVAEPDETFTLQLTGAGGADLGSPVSRLGTIVDATATPKLRVADTTVAENDPAGHARFLVTLSAPSAGTVTVKASTAAGTATSGTDFTAVTNQTVTFLPGELVEVVTVDVTDDSTTEPDETFTLNLSAPNGATVARAQGTATILDDDGVPAISIDDASVIEGNSGTASAAFTVSLTHPSSTAVTVRADTADGTAHQPGDYIAVPNQTVTIPAGSTSASLTVTVNGDVISEADETFAVDLSNPGGAVLGDASGTGTILDDDTVVSISVASEGDVAEGSTLVGGTATFDVTLSQASGQTVTVDYATVDGTATVLGLDYLPAGGTLTFNPGTTKRTVTVTLVGDAVPEGQETFSLHLSNPNAAATIGNNDALATILNDDGPSPQVTISGPVTSVPEGNSGTTNATFTVTLTNSLGPVTVNWATADGTATAGSDYTSASGTLLFLLGDGAQQITVPVKGDTLYEHAETFTVRLSSVLGALGAGSSAPATIANDDAAPALTATGTTVAEGKPGDVTAAAVTVSLSPASTVPATVTYTIPAGGDTATADVDYSAAATSGTLTFAPGETSKTVPLQVLGDNVDENDETVSVVLSSPTDATIGTGTGTVTITDDDAAPAVSVTDAAPVGEHDGLPAVFVVSLTNPSQSTVDVTVTTVSGTATSGSDFTAVGPTVLHFAPGGPLNRSVSVPVLDDGLAEAATETFSLALSSPANATLDPSASSGTGTIIDDDGPARLTVDNAVVAEGAASTTTTATFNVHLLPPAAADVTVDWVTGDASATAGSDYTAASATLTIHAGQTGGKIDVTVLGDNSDEIDETFALTLSNLSGAAFGPGGATLAATGTIDDDDQPVVSVTAPPPVTEGNSGTTPVRFLVKLSSASADPVTVHYTTSNSTATAGSDYTAIAGTATVPAGQTAVAVDVNVTGDTVNEDDETFALTLSGPVGATLGTASATATIGNDDGATLSIGDASVVEGDSATTAATFTVTLAPATTVGVSVNWATENRTATAGSDYHAASGTLTFAPGETTKAVTVTVNGDTANEADETFAVKLSGPSATAVLGDPEGIGSIVDDDTPGSITVDDVTVAEGTGAAQQKNADFTVHLSPARPKAVTVHYETVAGTATSPPDYAAASGTLTFAPGQTTKTVAVAVVPDKRAEINERFFLHLSAPTGATLAGADGTATIRDDDGPGYLVVGSDGSTYAFGDTIFGTTGSLTLHRPIVGAAATPSGNGYWMVASDGGVFSYGDAHFYGSTGNIALNKPIVSITATPTGNGYWMVASDGGIFGFGDAAYEGSAAGLLLTGRAAVALVAL